MKAKQSRTVCNLGNGGSRRAALQALFGLVGVFALSRRGRADTYLSAPSSNPAYPYGYKNTFPRGVGDFLTSSEAGGDVFAPTLQPGQEFPTDIEIFDEQDHKHAISEFMGTKPLVVVLTLISAPEVMRKVVNLQKFLEKQRRADANVIAIHVGQFGSVLQPKTPMADTGRTVRYTASEYHVKIPFYWVQNDIYSPKGFTNRLHVRDLPTVFVVNGSGQVVRTFGSDHTNWSAKDFSVG